MLMALPSAVLNNPTLFLYIPAILSDCPWRNAKSPLEMARQVALIGKPDLARDFGNHPWRRSPFGRGPYQTSILPKN